MPITWVAAGPVIRSQSHMMSTAKSSSIRILNSEPSGYSKAARLVLEEVGEVKELDLDRTSLLAALGDVEVLIVRLAHSVDREMIDAGRRLRVIVSATTGLDHIDLDYAAERGVAVLSLRGEHEFLSRVTSTAEHTWALLLALVRRLPAAISHVFEGGWDRDSFRGMELQGKRLAVVGMGRVGSIVAEYGRAFRMEVAAYDPDPRSWPDWVARADTLQVLVANADVLSIHVPLVPETVGLIDSEVLSRLPAGAVLVNTARSEVIDAKALLRSLETGSLAGAALDVVDSERHEKGRLEDPLIAYAREHHNLIITPHIGGATTEAMERTEVFMAEKLRRHFQGESDR